MNIHIIQYRKIGTNMRHKTKHTSIVEATNSLFTSIIQYGSTVY